MSPQRRRDDRARVARAATLIIALALALAPAPARAATSVTVAMSAGWRATSGALEALIGVGDVGDADAFWWAASALDRSHEDGSVDCAARVRSVVERALRDGGRARAMRLALGVRAYSPRLESAREMATRATGVSDACCRVVINGRVHEDAETLKTALESGEGLESGGETPTTRDAAYAGTFNESLATAFAYMAPGTRCYSAMHDVLAAAVEAGLVNYALRPVLFDAACAREDACAAYGATEDKLQLTGFGVELAVKNMEYKAIDDSKVAEGGEGDVSGGVDATTEESVAGFNFATLTERHPEHADGLRAFREELSRKSALASDAPLKLWDIKDLGLQATQRIALSADPLTELVEVSQNFPSLANSLSRMKLNTTMVKEVKANHKIVRPGGLVMSLNGENLELDTIDIYTLTETISREIEFSAALRRVGLPDAVVSEVLRLPKHSRKGVKIDTTSPVFAFYNDIEKDAKYATWSRDVRKLLAPMQAGMPQVRHNLYNLVVIMDPSRGSTWDLVAMLDYFANNGIPVRIAQVIVTDIAEENAAGPASEKIDETFGRRVARAANYLLSEYSTSAYIDFLTRVAGAREPDQPPSYFSMGTFFPPTWAAARDAFVSVLEEIADDDEFDADVLLRDFESADASMADKRVDDVRAALREKGLQTQSFLMNGEYSRESHAIAYGTTLDQLLSHQLRKEMDSVRRLVSVGTLTSSNVAEVLNEGAVAKYVPWILDEDDNVPVYARPVERESVSALEYAHAGDVESVKPMSLVVLADADSDRGARVIAEVAKHIESSGGSMSRFTVAHVGDAATMGKRARAVQAALRATKHREKVVPFIRELLDGASVDVDPEDVATRVGLSTSEFSRSMADDELASVVSLQSRRFARHHDLKSKCAIVAGGRVLDLVHRKCDVDAGDVGVLVAVEMSKRTKHIFDVVSEGMHSVDAQTLSSIVSDTSAVVAMKERSASNKRAVESLDEIVRKAKSTSFRAGRGTSIKIEAILDPLSKEAQRVAPVLALLRDRLSDEVTIEIVLNPVDNLSELPLTSYYRYVVPTMSAEEAPKAIITNVPTHKTLTMHVDFPEAWMVTTHKASYDLDNLILKDIPERIVRAEYRLESLLVTGHATDGSSGKPARGTQLVLENPSSSSGTIVMSNLGYFQLPASPGVRKLSLRSGRSADVFKFAEIEDLLDPEAPNAPPSKDGTSVEVLVDSFRGRQLATTFAKRPGMERQDVLNDDANSKKSSWMTSAFKKKEKERIHIFSVASGHLYERFLKIMMASVKRTTTNPVKFWFIKNWLSPSFKEFLPHMAKEYDFEFELVSYKWPTWLNKQTEKQRIIWAYKILFLDVLFPLELNKVIFVDADQIVRADMNELWTMNLHGAPYGYTPMCDNNKEMEGFRFWKQGFWKNHLRGRPYHISALYVVDLDRFRALAAGDQLRVMYDSLSRDPGSLANLDQDLPNYAQHEVPIFSLPQPWLWCESWCGNETKSVAKTIDLCNNPLTKEPKLEGARRIVAEWPGLDEEVRAFTARVEEGMKKPSAANAEANVRDEL